MFDYQPQSYVSTPSFFCTLLFISDASPLDGPDFLALGLRRPQLVFPHMHAADFSSTYHLTTPVVELYADEAPIQKIGKFGLN